MLLTSLPVAISRDNSCVLAQAGIRNAEKERISRQHLSKLTFEFTCYLIDISVNAFPIEISDAVILCACLCLTRFVMFSSGRNSL